MEHRREFKEEEEATVPLLEQQVPSAHEEEEEEEEGEAEESPRVHKSFFSDPTPPIRDDWIQGRGRGREISASLGAMRPLLVKLDILLLAPPQGCSNSNRVKDGMRLLKDDVEKMSSYLDQLSELEDPPPRAKCWMNEARDLSYDMEDYIDNLIFVRPEDPSLVRNNIKTTRSRLKFRSHLKLFGRAKTPKTQAVIIAETLSEFKMYVQEAIERHQRYGLHSCSTLRHRFVSLGPMLLPIQYEDIVIDGRMNGFIKSLAEDGEQQLKALSVLGPACIGKTTLAKVLYNRLGKQYQCRAFIRVSKKPNMKTILLDMLSQLQRQHPPQNYMEIDLVHNIKQYLQDKRYLIIIDDVWATSVWDTINHAFPKGSQGSRIVATTQIEDVAIACCCYQSEHVFEMKPLDDDHSRKLFFNRIFGSESDCPEELKEVSNKILEICDGLPLATISIASLVASQPVMSIDLFTYIHQSLCSCFSANSTSEITRQVLSLSYNNLPHYLKTCLLYLSMYQEGYTFCKDDLLKQWVAEGLIHTTEGQEMEKVAESYLHQLIGRRFIQPICINYNNEVLSCAVHDVVHDLIAHKSAEENFIVAIDYSCRKSVALSQKARRLSLVFGDARYAKIPSNIAKSQVRSLRFFGLLESMPSITEFKLLRVLNLQLSGHGGDDDDPVDLTGISEMFQLRYLKIACDVCIKLPNRVLQCLETLDITDAKVAYVPRDIHLPNLLHLCLPVDKNLPDWINSRMLLGLERVCKRHSLQDLRLTRSSTLYSDHLNRSMSSILSLLGGHGNLKTIVVAHGSLAKSVRGASDVTLPWDLLAPPLLQRFEFSPHSGIIFSRIPPWFLELGNLCILKIAVRELQMSCVDILRGLPALTALSLYVQMKPTNNIIFTRAGLSVLKYFKLRFTSGIAWLKFEAGAMPSLRKLKLVFDAIPPMDHHLLYAIPPMDHHLLYAIPPMDHHLLYSSNECTFKRHQRGTAVISIEHMPGLGEISVKFGGAAADIEYALRTFVSNHPSNPTIDMQSMDYSSYGNESTRQKQEPANEILEEESDEYDKTLQGTADKRSLESSSRLHVFTLDELLSATSNFSAANFLGGFSMANYLGKRGGGVYKGSVDGNLIIAVKYPDDHFDCEYRELQMQAVYLQKMSHPHLVKLLGFCNQYPRRMLVYEYMPRGSLQDHLHENLVASLPWLTRLKIAVGAAKGLAFLHEAGELMIYGGFKASNILLGSDYTAKLSGFGLRNEDTRRYMWDVETDVYNFGVLLLELMAGRPSVDKKRHGREQNLLKEMHPYQGRADELHHIMDPSLKGQYSVHAARSTAMIMHMCLQSVPTARPRMRDVLDALEPLLALVDDNEVTLDPCRLGGAGGEQHVVSWSNIISVIGRDLFNYCLARLSRSDYGTVACLNRDFNSLVHSGEIYRLRRKNAVVEHWLYFSCNVLEWDAYDPYSGHWIQVPRMPPDECFMCSDKESLAVGTELLVFGMAHIVYRYSILTNSWTRANPMNSPRCLFGSTSVGEKAYVAGGTDASGRILSSAEMYDSETHTWTPLPSMNRARKMCSGAFMDGKFYVIGGVTNNNKVLTCGEEYDLKQLSWRVIENMSEGLNGVTGAPPLIAAVNNQLYAADYSEKNVKRYDKLNNKWIVLGKLPERSVLMNGWGLAFRACGDQLIVIGGPRTSIGGIIELHSWIPDQQPPVWNLVTRRQSGNFVYNCAVMGC